jgi:hypothetical protein
MADTFKTANRGLADPATTHYTITPSDSVDLPSIPRVLYILTGGNIAVRDRSGVDITYAVVSGQVFQFSATRILSTGTTATMVGWE